MKLELLTALPHLWIGYLLAMCQSQQGHTTSLGGESRPASGNGMVETLQLHSKPTVASAADVCQWACHVPGLGGAWVLSERCRAPVPRTPSLGDEVNA